jgi:hypothetical protein
MADIEKAEGRKFRTLDRFQPAGVTDIVGL